MVKFGSMPAYNQWKVRKKTEALLNVYLDDRIRFFNEDTVQGQRTWSQIAREKQNQLWQGAVQVVEHNPTPVMVSMLAVYSDLYTSFQETQADWRRQIPDAGWVVLILFAACSSFLSGYQYRGKAGRHLFIILLPSLTALALFMIAEIDFPGEGIIRVKPDDLHQLAISLFKTTEAINGPLSSVHHVR